jgi:hypothetical protein
MEAPRATLRQLQAAARSFNTKNHVSYLAEALQCLRETEDPVAALRLLHAMCGSPFASRADQRAALHDIGFWIEARLYREPAAGHDAIAWELGWLRRFAHSASTTSEESKPRDSSLPLEFGRRIARIEKRRAEEAAAQRQLLLASAAPPPEPPPPTHLPPVFQASFVDFGDARQARQTARKRAKSGKPAKERWLELRPVDPRLQQLAAGLVCGVQSTEGFDALLDADQQTFYVTALEEREGRKIVISLALQPSPADEAHATGTSP